MLELKDLQYAEDRVTVIYNVAHSGGRTATILEQDFKLTIDTQTGQVEGELHLTELKVDSIEAARERMAVWCERMATALRRVKRKSGDLPLYQRASFELEELPLWMQQEYERLVQFYVNAKTEEDHEAIRTWLKDHPMSHVGDLVEVAKCQAERLQEASQE